MRRSRRKNTPAARFPGTTAALTVGDYESSGGHRFGLLHCASTHRVTIVLDVDADLDVFVDLFARHEHLDLGPGVDVDAIAAVVETTPTGDAYLSWIDGQSPDGGRCGVALRLAVTFAVLTRERRKDIAEEALEIGRRLPGLISSLTELGLAARPLTARDVTTVVTTGYEETGPGPDTAFGGAVTTDIEQKRDMLVHAGLHTVAATVGSAAIDEQTLTALVRPTWSAPRRRVAVVYRATVPAVVDGEVVPVDGDTPEGRPHRLARMGAILTVTEPAGRTPQLEAVRTPLTLAARLALRRGYDSQAALMAASLGVGVLLPDAAVITDIAV